MLAITAKVKLLKEEVASAKTVCKGIISNLNALTDNSDYRKELGIFVVQSPNWKILNDEKKEMTNIIRKVCTGELPPLDAIPLFNAALNELNALDKWLQVPKK